MAGWSQGSLRPFCSSHSGHRRQPSAMLKCQPPARHPPSDGDFCAGKMDTF
ncbi:hypothetical protein MGG_17173 [Pyricularia oryzae 70-15]|uniref:Uncharacterized protein n=1 Tax=Pyricularia oryzae (strain 70-15 / ATCC MYA-4617 / FGSC 8958) TaxID=242507 RepID=G4N6M4_PYRO7|nr:uncharacterized protein MGG_17173 [Pyricularia oryzae 70-15]EHA50693.1 hypothetical protein MGG_17173 [Pyricularia oryzae 70-15]